MKLIKSLFFIGLLLVALISNAQENRHVKTDTYEGVIFAKYYNATSEIAWNPYLTTDQEIAKMEKKISYSIRIIVLAYKKQAFLPEGNAIVENIQKYKREYYGYWYGGEKNIRVFFYIDVPKNRAPRNLPKDRNARFLVFELEYSIDHDALRDFRSYLSEE